MLVLVAFRHNSNIVLEGTAQAPMHCTECLFIRALAVIRLLHGCRNPNDAWQMFTSPPRRGAALILLEPIPTAANIAEVAVAIFACMHVCRIPPYVVGRFLRFLACDVSPGVLIRTGSNASSIIDESTKLKPETHLDIYRHTVGCGTRATSTRRWRRGGRGEEWRVSGDRQCYIRSMVPSKKRESLSHLSPGGFLGSMHIHIYVQAKQTKETNNIFIPIGETYTYIYIYIHIHTYTYTSLLSVASSWSSRAFPSVFLLQQARSWILYRMCVR